MSSYICRTFGANHATVSTDLPTSISTYSNVLCCVIILPSYTNLLQHTYLVLLQLPHLLRMHIIWTQNTSIMAKDERTQGVLLCLLAMRSFDRPGMVRGVFPLSTVQAPTNCNDTEVMALIGS